MKIAVVGQTQRSIAWEKHLRKLTVIKEVVLTDNLTPEDKADAVLLIDDSPERIAKLLHYVRLGHHTYLIARLSDEIEKLEKVYHSAEESGVTVQFSHWPSMSESTQLSRQIIDKPDLIQIKKECIPLSEINSAMDGYDYDWIDEVALIIKWMGGNIHRCEIKPLYLGSHFIGLALSLRFENSSVASLQYLSHANREYHQRVISSKYHLIDCDITGQTARVLSLNNFGKISVKHHEFDPSDTAEWSVAQFIKSIQMHRESVFSAYDALMTARTVQRIRSEIT